MAKILVIEDEADIRNTIKQILEFEGHDVLSASDGVEGVNSAKENIPDLIISDVNMPELDGFGVITELRNNKSTSTIPIILLTARSEKEDIREGMNLGADDYLNKPFTIDELKKSIKTRLDKLELAKDLTSKKLDELRTNITMSMPHELRTPLYGIIGFAEVLSNDVQNIDIREVSEMSTMILENAQRLNKSIENYLLFAHLQFLNSNSKTIEQLKDQITTINDELVRNFILEKLSTAPREKDLILLIESAHLKIHANYLKIIIEQITSNCFDYSEPGTEVIISGVEDGNYYGLTFIDNGRGMNEKQISEIGGFMQFDRNIYEQQGTGMGLALTKNIVSIFNGKFEITSEISKGTQVEIVLPVSN